VARIVVTGGTGFIGRTLVGQLLSEGCEVVIPSRDPSRVRGDNLSWRVLYRMATKEAGFLRPRMRLPSGAVRSLGHLAERFNMLGLDAGSPQMLTAHWVYDDSRARRELEYQSRAAHQTIRESIEWYRESGKLRRDSRSLGGLRSRRSAHRVNGNG